VRNRPERTIRLLAAALVLLAAPAPRAYDFSDAIAGAAPNGTGARQAFLSARALSGAVSRVEVDPDAEDFLSFLWESIHRFDFRELYESPHLELLDDGYRGVVVLGENRGDSYFVSLAPPGAWAGKLPGHGSLAVRVGLRKNPDSIVGDTSYSILFQVKTDMEALSPQYYLELAENFLRVLDPANLERLAENVSGDPSTVVSRVFARNFPWTVKALSPYLRTRLHVETVETDQGSCSRVTLAVGYNDSAVAADLPLAADYFHRLDRLTETMGTVTDTCNQVLSAFALRTKDDLFYLRFVTKNGLLVPVTEDDLPVPGKAVSLAKARELPFRFVLDMDNYAKGLWFHTEDLVVRAALKRGQDQGGVDFLLGDAHRTTISGRIYNVFPTWLVDLFIPGNMEELVDDFHRVAADANNGQGTRASLSWSSQGPGSRVYYESQSEIVDNYFIRFLFGALRDNFQADEKTAAQLRAFSRLGKDALLADLEALAKAPGRAGGETTAGLPLLP